MKMRATQILLLATCLASANAFPLVTGNQHQPRSEASSTELKPGTQIKSPCPELVDPKSDSTAAYYYKPISKDQDRVNQYVNDHWGLPECCDKTLHVCKSPPDPGVNPNPPCPELIDPSNGMPFLFYNNAYTTDQFMSNYIIVLAIQNNQCQSAPQPGSVSSFPTPPNSNLNTKDVATFSSNSEFATWNVDSRR